MSYELDPKTVEYLKTKPDFQRKQMEAKFRTYTPHEQRQWIANPMVMWLLQMVQRDITPSNTGKSKNTPVKPNINDNPDPKPDSDNDSDSDDVGMMDLFD